MGSCKIKLYRVTLLDDELFYNAQLKIRAFAFLLWCFSYLGVSLHITDFQGLNRKSVSEILHHYIINGPILNGFATNDEG